MASFWRLPLERDSINECGSTSNRSFDAYSRHADEACSPVEGRPLFSIEIALDEESGHIWYREQTDTDFLIASISRTPERVREEYVANGNHFATNYPNIGPRGIAKAKELFYQGRFPVIGSRAFLEVGEKLAEFDAFYRPYRSNSLHNNPEGARLMSALTDHSLRSLIVEGTPHGERPLATQRVDGWDSRFCWGATVCMTFKCLTGNPLCIPCSGAVVACVIMEIACWFIGCDCCF